MERIAVTLDDGSVAILYFENDVRCPTAPFGALPTARPGYWYRPASDENIAVEVMKTFHGDGIASPVSWRRMPELPPQDREFRDAWVDRAGRVEYDMPRARAIRLARLRELRDAELKLLDIEWTRAAAQRRSQEADAIEAQRQALRDMPQRVRPLLDAAETVEDLKLVQ